ncbi:uncharacterized protein PAN0_011d4278 [Moesziomyces antarcticus]|uniref:Uncharacterized protein n=2 Tax=Pseudozyma antarctica TaxID=84753 RepID=A0A5C3FQY0_PSEA2|nr:uncharacterized protein PAN0_011d4278 [Moesziomyces antarcticus]GAK66056.1 conserved hypothetical protein [Moesziomyces antarcticus]SPO46834.1 uncharacterized protein PSANT_04520 [Moesziomyces antarcticus]
MRLPSLLKLGCASVLATLCIFPHRSIAVGGDAGPSSAPFWVERPTPRVENYITLLHPHRIALLRHDAQLHPNVDSYQYLPFMDGFPLFTTRTDPETAEMALSYYGRVGILDTARHDGRLIKYGNARLEQDLLPDLDRALNLHSLDSKVHRLRHLVLRGGIAVPPRPDILSLPHVRGVPVLTAEFSTLDQMLHAAGTGNGDFWYLRSSAPIVKITPREEGLYELATARDVREIERVSSGVRHARLRYGDSLSSLLWGAPIELRDLHRQDRIRRPSLAHYPRLVDSESRDEMIHALQTRGRFRLYRSGQHAGERFKVMLINPDAQQGTRMRIEVRPLTNWERTQEDWLVRLGKTRLPV